MSEPSMALTYEAMSSPHQCVDLMSGPGINERDSQKDVVGLGVDHRTPDELRIGQ